MYKHLLFCVALSCTLAAWPLEIEWTLTTGQYPVEAAPALIQSDGQPALLAANRNGEVMLWNLDGTNRGPGQDGLVAQLPQGLWTSSLVAAGERFLFCSDEGKVVALDMAFQKAWEFQLTEGVSFGCGVPAQVALDDGTFGLCLGDESGTITCLDVRGVPVWRKDLESGACETPVISWEDKLLAAAGSRLFCLDRQGNVVWSSDLGKPVSAGPEVFAGLIVCAVEGGVLAAVSTVGQAQWQITLDDDIECPLAFLPRRDKEGLILTKGLWGNLHALSLDGKHVWTHVFRTKSRSKPLVFDANGDGRMEVLVTAYNQHAYLFDEDGNLLDDLRLNGCANGSPILVEGEDRTRPGIVVVTATLTAQRFRFSRPSSPYGATGEGGYVMWDPPVAGLDDGPTSLVLRNPRGTVLAANCTMKDAASREWKRGRVTAQSVVELPLPIQPGGALSFSVQFPDGSVPNGTTAYADIEHASPAQLPDGILVWQTPAYATFDDKRISMFPREHSAVNLNSELYMDEVGERAFIIACNRDVPCQARLEFDIPNFGGTFRPYQVVATGTVNGEDAPDALVALGDASLVTLPARRSVKIWLSLDAHQADPSEYVGVMHVRPLHDDAPVTEQEFRFQVLPLRMPHPFPIALCTWDYVPNRWFPMRTADVLDDMSQHGVNIFPRTELIPSATVDAQGRLEFAWEKTEKGLELLKGRGQVLFQIGHPPITFAEPPSPEKQRELEIAYLRTWRDHLKELGWDYADYALYPVDEPGLGFGPTVPILIDAAQLFREADPLFRIYTDPVPTLSRRDFNRIENLIDVWCPNMRFVTGLAAQDPRIARIRASGKTLWSYECVSQVKSLSPLRYNRANAWRADFFGLTGIGVWTHSTTEVNHWFAGKGTNDEYALVYPGELPVPSIRWEALRDGLEDVAAMHVLAKAIADAREKGLHAEIITEAEEALRIAHVDIMELSDAAFVESRDYLKAGDRRIWHTWTDIETYARHRENIAALTRRLGS